ncbi:MAG: hypothetical protein WED34_08015, partial [Planctomycetales bacterium]
ALAGCSGQRGPDAAAAQWVLRTGGWVELRDAAGGTHDSRAAGPDLPGEFQILKIGWRSYPGDAFPEVDDDVLAQLAGLEQLEELDLSGTAVTDAGLEPLTALSGLSGLYLNDTAVSDAAVPHLSRLGRLKILSIGGTRITWDGVRRLQQSLPGCRITN